MGIFQQVMFDCRRAEDAILQSRRNRSITKQLGSEATTKQCAMYVQDDCCVIADICSKALRMSCKCPLISIHTIYSIYLSIYIYIIHLIVHFLISIHVYLFVSIYIPIYLSIDIHMVHLVSGVEAA